MYATRWKAEAIEIRSHKKWTGTPQRYINIRLLLERNMRIGHHKTCTGCPRTINCVLESHSLENGTRCGYTFMFDTRILSTKPSDNRGVLDHTTELSTKSSLRTIITLALIVRLHHFVWLLIATKFIWS